VATVEDRYGRFARLVAIDADVGGAARVIVENGWHAESEPLARALVEAAALSAEERQSPERFAELIADCLQWARVTRVRGALAFELAMTPDVQPRLVEVRLESAQWRFLISGERRPGR